MELALLTCDNQVLSVKGCVFIDFCGFSAKIHQRLEHPIPLQCYEPCTSTTYHMSLHIVWNIVSSPLLYMYTLYLETFATCHFYFAGTTGCGLLFQ